MLISWDDVDRTEVAGWHPVKRLGITVNIRQQEIDTWKDDPHGRFTVVEVSYPVLTRLTHVGIPTAGEE